MTVWVSCRFFTGCCMRLQARFSGHGEHIVQVLTPSRRCRHACPICRQPATTQVVTLAASSTWSATAVA
jgi:hypothetical protein